MATRTKRRQRATDLETKLVQAGLPEAIKSPEVVIASFRCTARPPRKSKIKGRLFLTQNFIIFKSEDCLFTSTIPLCQVRSAACHRSKKTKLFPSVVTVSLREELRTFSHCGRRRDCVSLIEHLAQYDPATSRMGDQAPVTTNYSSAPLPGVSPLVTPDRTPERESNSASSSFSLEDSGMGSGRWKIFVDEAEEIVSGLDGASPQRHAEAMQQLNQMSDSEDNNFDESEIDSLLASDANYSGPGAFLGLSSRPDVFGEGTSKEMADCPLLLWKRNGTVLHPWMHYRRGFIRWHDYHFSIFIHGTKQSSQELHASASALNTETCAEEKKIFYNEVTALLHLSRPLHFVIETSDERLVFMSAFARTITEHLLSRSKQEVQVVVSNQSPLSVISPSDLPLAYTRPGSDMEPLDQELN